MMVFVEAFKTARRQDGRARGAGPFSPVAISSGATLDKNFFGDYLVAAIEPVWGFQKNISTIFHSWFDGGLSIYFSHNRTATDPIL